MALQQINITGADGADATTINTNSDAIVAFGSSSIVIQSASPYKTFKALKYTGDGANASYMNWQFTTDATHGAASLAMEIPSATPPSDLTFASIYDVAASRMLQLIYRTNGQVVVADADGVYHTLLTATQAVVGTWFRFEIVITTASATTATYHVTVYTASDAAVSGATYTASGTGNTGTNGLLHVLRTGVTTAMAYAIRMTAIQWDDGRTTEIGPMTISIGNPSVAVTSYGPAYYIDAATSSSVGSGSSGTLSFTATHSSGPTNAMWQLATGKFVFLMDTTTDAQWTITGTDSATGRTASVLVTVPHQAVATSTVSTSITETVVLSSGIWA